MEEKGEIKPLRPKPYEIKGVKFNVFGKIPKTWLLDGKYGLGVNLLEISGNEFMGVGADVIPGIFFKFQKKVRFHSSIDLSLYEIPKHPRGLILEISGHGDKYLLLPVVIKGSDPVQETEYLKLKKELSDAVKKITKLKEDWSSYRNELGKMSRSIVYDNGILEGIFEILEQSQETFPPFSESEEDRQEEALREKYKEAVESHGPLLGGVVGRMNGFEFRVYSGDHEPKHFHVIHKGRGVDARFSFPQFELINYKGHSATIGTKESEKIREFFKAHEYLQKLDGEFKKQII